MNQKFNVAIEEMKGVMMNLYRSASDLDRFIQNIESESIKDDDNDYIRMVVMMQQRYRIDSKKSNNRFDLDKQEKEAWDHLIESLK